MLTNFSLINIDFYKEKSYTFISNISNFIIAHTDGSLIFYCLLSEDKEEGEGICAYFMDF